MLRNRKPCNSLFMANMASGMDCGHVHPTTKNAMQHGYHTPANTKSWFTAYIFDIGHPYYGQLTPVETRYLLTCVM